ncbi:MAG: prepilin-type N-terminal cleavage/methylation domain-containing protein [Patescibacteria group bacterium]
MASLARSVKGFTLIEAVLVVAVLTLVVGATVPKFSAFSERYQVDNKSDELTQLLRIARNKSMMSESDSPYGVHLVTGTAGSFTLFKGATYATRDTSYDEEVHTLPNGITLGKTVAASDVVFTKVEGSTSNAGSITVALQGTTVTHTISVNSAGMVQLD